ncbi:hypothetical protein [Helicobacter sp. 23-1045]
MCEKRRISHEKNSSLLDSANHAKIAESSVRFGIFCRFAESKLRRIYKKSKQILRNSRFFALDSAISHEKRRISHEKSRHCGVNRRFAQITPKTFFTFLLTCVFFFFCIIRRNLKLRRKNETFIFKNGCPSVYSVRIRSVWRENATRNESGF